MKQNPFSIYDFLGYLIPGSTLTYLFLIFEKLTDEGKTIKLEEIFSSVSKYNFNEIFFFVIVSYSLGHIINFISSITIEKYGNWKYAYPSKTVIGFYKNSYWVEKEKPENSNENQIIYEVETDTKKRNFKNAGRFFLIILLLPLFIIEYIFGRKLRFNNFYSKGLDKYLTRIIKTNVLLLLNSEGISNIEPIKEIDLKEIDFNRIVHHYAFENSKEHQFRMVNYVALFGFLRNLVLIFVFLSWFYLYISIKTINYKSGIDCNSICINISLMFLSFIAFMAYMKFYRRYTLEGLILIVVDKNIKKK